MDNVYIENIYNKYASSKKLVSRMLRTETIEMINSLTQSKEDTNLITAHIFALISYYYNGVKLIEQYPGKYGDLLGSILYKRRDLPDDIIRVLHSFITDANR